MPIYPKNWTPPTHTYTPPTKAQKTAIKKKIEGYVTEDRVYYDDEVCKYLKESYPQFIDDEFPPLIEEVQKAWHPPKPEPEEEITPE